MKKIEYKVIVDDHRDNDNVVMFVERWYYNNILHRENGPCIITKYKSNKNEDKLWKKYDVKHREDGPAIEWNDGTKEYWINGKRITEEEFNNRTKKDYNDGKIIILDGKEYKLILNK